MIRVALLIGVLAIHAAAQMSDWPAMPDGAMKLLMQGKVEGAATLLRTSAEAGDTVAMFWLAKSLEELDGLPRDYREAMRWYSKAADQKLGVAAWSIGRLHDMGRGTSRDPDAAQTWYGRAAEFGFRRTALTCITVRSYPGSGELEYQPGSPPNLTTDELARLRKAGLRGRLAWQSSQNGQFGIPARIILIAHKRVTAEVLVRVPVEGSIIYVQRNDSWHSVGEAKTADRHVRIHPQSPDDPSNSSITVEMEGGGLQSGSGWSWGGR
jgi:hypothetical protein